MPLGPAPATGTVAGPAATAILLVDQDRLYGQSTWGKRVETEIADASAQLSSENRSIEAALTEEEKLLTERRSGLDPKEFRKEADAFDAKVVAIRAAQEAKSRDITQRRDSERQAFYKAALPFFAKVMRDRGAVVILDKRSVFLSANAIDVTDELVDRVNADLGAGPVAGQDAGQPPETPPTAPPIAPTAEPQATTPPGQVPDLPVLPDLPQDPTSSGVVSTPGGN